jgi:hypothetical protein
MKGLLPAVPATARLRRPAQGHFPGPSPTRVLGRPDRTGGLARHGGSCNGGRGLRGGRVVGAGPELGVGPACLVVPREPDAAPPTGAADVPDQMHVDLLAAVRLVVRAQGDVGPDDAGWGAAVGEGLVDGLEVGPVRQTRPSPTPSEHALPPSSAPTASSCPTTAATPGERPVFTRRPAEDVLLDKARRRVAHQAGPPPSKGAWRSPDTRCASWSSTRPPNTRRTTWASWTPPSPPSAPFGSGCVITAYRRVQIDLGTSVALAPPPLAEHSQRPTASPQVVSKLGEITLRQRAVSPPIDKPVV